MKITVYLDILILTNWIINYFLLRITAIAAGCGYVQKRFILSSFVGALFSVTVFWNINTFWMPRFIKVLSLTICVLIAFDVKSVRYFLRCLTYFVFVNFLAGGVLFYIFENSPSAYINNMFFYININPIIMVNCILGVYILITISDFFISDRAKDEKYQFQITINGCDFIADGFHDTGFQIKDIISGRAVLLCSGKLLSNDFGDITTAVKCFLNDEYTNDKRITPIFYSDISGQGILPAVKPEQVICINQKGRKIKLENILIAFTDSEISKDLKILFGKSIFNMIGD